jgi:uncharacterized protein (TIGR03067 family)
MRLLGMDFIAPCSVNPDAFAESMSNQWTCGICSAKGSGSEVRGFPDSEEPIWRRIMRTLGLTVLTAGCLLLGAGHLLADDTEKKDLDALKGTWRVQSHTVNGVKTPEKEAKEYTYVFKGEKYTQLTGGKEQVSGKVKLDVGKKPKVIAMTGKLGGKKGLPICGSMISTVIR